MASLEVVVRLSATLLLFSRALQVSGQTDFVNKKITQLGGLEYLHCSNTTDNVTDLNSYTPMAWMLPNLTVLHTSKDRFEFLDENWTLAISSVTADDLGLYNCLLLGNKTDGSDEWLVNRLGLNAAVPTSNPFGMNTSGIRS